MRGFIIRWPSATFGGKAPSSERNFVLCIGNTCIPIKRGSYYPFYVLREERAQLVELDERRFERETEMPVVETYYGWEAV